MTAPHLLLLATTTGYQTRVFAEAARRLGVRLTLASDRCDHLDDPWGDGAIPVRFENPGKYAGYVDVLAAAGPFTAVVALGDRTTPLAALAAECMGLRFHPPAAAEAAKSKYLTKERFRAAGMLLPDYRRFPVEMESIDAAARAVQYPCVLKPLGMSGSRGVIRADDSSQFCAAFGRITALLNEPDVLRFKDPQDRYVQVEDFIPGAEFAIEGLMTGGRLRVLAIFDKPDPLDGPHFEETIYVTPSRQPDAVQRDLVDAVGRGAAALGLAHGPIHAEARVNDRGVYMLEIAARPIGGLCAKALLFQGGVSFGGPRRSLFALEELILRHALGEDVSHLELLPEASGVMMIPIPRAGVYKGVAGLDLAGQTTGIEEIIITAKEGQLLKMFPEASSYLGFIFARGADAAMVEQALREAHRGLRFDIAMELLPR